MILPLKEQFEKLSLNRGFTLIEVMTAVSIFTIVTTIGLGALLTMVDASKKAQSQRVALDSVQFVMDTMSREIRTGYRYVRSENPDDYQPTGNNGAGTYFSFTNQDGCPVTYRLHEETIQRRRQGACNTNGYEVLTNPSILTVDNLWFRVRGADADTSDTLQPFVSFAITATASAGRFDEPVRLHTGVAQRLLDIPAAASPVNN